MKTKQVIYLFLSIMQCCLIVYGVKIAAFNIRTFGKTKASNPLARIVITQIIHKYDIIVIQEIRGFRTPTKIPNEVLQWVNQDGSDFAICNSAFNYKPNRGSHRELYLFLYRPAIVTCMGTDESESLDPEYANRFRRPPTVGKFSVTSESTTVKTHFFIVGIHTQPSRAIKEINALVDVYGTLKKEYGIDLGFIMGDFNYGGSYVRSSLQDHLDIDQPPFIRLINKTDATTVKPFHPTSRVKGKPYDRIYAVPGRMLITAAGIDKFRDMLTPEQYYRSVSDHYPVYVEVDIDGKTESYQLSPDSHPSWVGESGA